MGRYTTHMAIAHCTVAHLSWHNPHMTCKIAACKTKNPNRITHRKSMVSCKRCAGIQPPIASNPYPKPYLAEKLPT